MSNITRLHEISKQMLTADWEGRRKLQIEFETLLKETTLTPSNEFKGKHIWPGCYTEWLGWGGSFGTPKGGWHETKVWQLDKGPKLVEKTMNLALANKAYKKPAKIDTTNYKVTMIPEGRKSFK